MASDNDQKPTIDNRSDKPSNFNDGGKSITITSNVQSGSTFPIKPGESQGSGSVSTGKSEGSNDSKSESD